MSDRLCGYCREAGHNKSNCPMMDEQRNAILSHTPIQRWKVINRLHEMGLGPGAMIRYRLSRLYGFGSSHDFLAFMNGWDWIGDTHFHQAQNVRNTKRCRVTYLDVDRDYKYKRLYIPFLLMGDGSGAVHNVGVMLEETKEDSYWSNKCFDIVSPVHHSDWDPELLVKNIVMPGRLRRNGESIDGMRGVMPKDY